MDNKGKSTDTWFDKMFVDGPFNFNSVMNDAASTPNQNQGGHYDIFQDLQTNRRDNYSNNIMHDPPHFGDWHNVTSAPQWKRGVRRARNNRPSDSLLVSPPSDSFGFGDLNNNEALGTWQNNDVAATSVTQSSNGGPMYTTDSATGFVDTTGPYLGSESGPSPLSPILRGASPPPGAIDNFEPLDSYEDKGDEIKRNIQDKVAQHRQWNASYYAPQSRGYRNSTRYDDMPVLDCGGLTTEAIRHKLHTGRLTLARRQKQAQGVGETIHWDSGSDVTSPAPGETCDCSSSETVMPDEESFDRQVPLADGNATDGQPPFDQPSSSAGRNRLSPTANDCEVEAGGSTAHSSWLDENTRSRIHTVTGTYAGDSGPSFQPLYENIAPTFAQDDEEMSEADDTFNPKSPSVNPDFTTNRIAEPLHAPSITTTVDVGSPVSDALCQVMHVNPAGFRIPRPMLIKAQIQARNRAQTQAQAPAPITQSTKFNEEILYALIFEPSTEPGEKYYNLSNQPGWAVTVESLPEISAGHCLDRLMGDHALGEAIAHAMINENDESDREWVVRAVFPFGDDGAMVVVRKV